MKSGFTKIELVIVMAVMFVLGWITYQQFSLAKAKSRDVDRKADLHELSKAIRLYYSDYGKLPMDEEINNLWGKQWIDKDYVYMKEVPKEKYLNKQYCYKQGEGGKDFWLMAELEYRSDTDCRKDAYKCGSESYCFSYNLPSEVAKND